MLIFIAVDHCYYINHCDHTGCFGNRCGRNRYIQRCDRMHRNNRIGHSIPD